MNRINTLNLVRRLMTSTIAGGALAFGFAAASPAADSPEVRSITVKYADLNLSSPEGAAALYGRIRAAAKSVCATSDDRALWSQSGVDACVHKAIADAVMKVNKPALFGAYNDHNKTPLPGALLSQTR
jgi:UrcA family protein